MKQFLLYTGTLVSLIFLVGCADESNLPGGSGMLEATEAVVSCEQNGKLLSIRVNEGQPVMAGDTLAIIDPTNIKLELASLIANDAVIQKRIESGKVALAQAEENHAFMTKEVARLNKLKAGAAASEKQLDQLNHELSQAALAIDNAQTGIATARAEQNKLATDIERLQSRLDDCFPLAPMNGVILETFLEQGELATPGKALISMADISSLWVKVYLPAGQFSEIKLGDPAKIDTETDREPYSGTVVWTSSEAEFTPKNVQTENSRTNLVYAVKVTVANTDGTLKIGMPVFVTLGE